jgi:hypothetical protein
VFQGDFGKQAVVRVSEILEDKIHNVDYSSWIAFDKNLDLLLMSSLVSGSVGLTVYFLAPRRCWRKLKIPTDGLLKNKLRLLEELLIQTLSHRR